MKYVLVTVAAGVILAIVADSWFVKGIAPSKILVGTVLILVLAPLASRINIFELIDFRKSVDRLDGELTDAREEIAEVAANVQTLQLGIIASTSSSLDQVINVNLGETMSPTAIQERSDRATEAVIEHGDRQDSFVLSPAFRLRWYLEGKIEVAITQVTNALQGTYVWVEAYNNGLYQDAASQAMGLTLSDLISYFRENKSLRPMHADEPTDEEDMDYLRRLEDLNSTRVGLETELNLMLLERDQLLDQSNPGPDPKVIRANILEAELVKAYFIAWAFGLSASYAMVVRALKNPNITFPNQPEH